jgi:hypothetical protein
MAGVDDAFSLFDASDDDDEEELRPTEQSEEELAAIAAAAAAALADAAANAKFKVGEAIEARYMGSTKFYPGKVESFNADSSYAIVFDDGDQDRNVLEASIQRPAAPVDG